MNNVKFANWQARLGIGREGTYGTTSGVDTIKRFISTEKFSFDFKMDSTYKTGVGVQRAETDSYKVSQTLTPSLEMLVQPDNVGEIFCAFFGTWTDGTQTPNAAGTQYSHIYKPAGTIQDNFSSVMFKLDYGQGTAYDYFGCRANKLSLAVNAKEVVKLTADFIGQREVAGTSAPVAVIYGTFQPWDFSDMTITVDGTALDGISNLQLDMDNAFSDGFRLGTQAFTTRPLPGGRFVNTLKFTNEYNGVDRARYSGGTNVGITIKFSGQNIGGTGNNELWFRYPRVDYTIAPFSQEKDGLLCLAITGRGLENGTSSAGTGYPVQLELYNTINAY